MEIWRPIESNEEEKEEAQINCFSNLLKVNDEKRKILVVGEVQSGKTKAIINLIKAAIEQSYSYVFVLGGTNTNLLHQTKNRIKEEITEFSLINGKEIVYYETKTAINKANIYNVQQKNKFNIFLFLKIVDGISNAFEAILQNYYNKNKKILIIDDECDYASTNTGENSESAVYSLIKKMYLDIKSGALVSVTATPWANVIADQNDDLYHDLIYLLETNDEYTGINSFDAEKDKIYEKSQVNEDDKDNLKNEVIYSIQCWLVLTSYMRVVEKNKEKIKSQLLINTSLINAKHDNVHKIIVEYINFLNKKEQTDLNKKQTNLLTKKFGNTWSEKEKEIIQGVNKIIDYFYRNKESIMKLNSDERNKENIFNIYINEIIVGGTKASRGLTFENLLVELILNTPKNKNSIDVLLQRARWFGYRRINKYSDVNRMKYMYIIMHEKIYNSLIEAKMMTEFLKENYNKQNFKDKILQKRKELYFTKLSAKERDEK